MDLCSHRRGICSGIKNILNATLAPIGNFLLTGGPGPINLAFSLFLNTLQTNFQIKVSHNTILHRDQLICGLVLK